VRKIGDALDVSRFASQSDDAAIVPMSAAAAVVQDEAAPDYLEQSALISGTKPAVATDPARRLFPRVRRRVSSASTRAASMRAD
jgi:hypothetical protein